MSGARRPQRTSLLLQLDNRVGALEAALAPFSRLGLNLTQIESRPTRGEHFDIYVDCEGAPADPRIQQLLTELEAIASSILVLDQREVAWFPRESHELDQLVDETLNAGTELESDHPGFQDASYRARRDELAAIAYAHRTGEEIPRIEYSAAEHATWRAVWEQLAPLQARYGCEEYLRARRHLMRECAFGPDAIPQLADVSAAISRRTGFRMRPVPGLLGGREFLAGLAFRVFFCTQYIRHPSVPLYTPEPDVCHELLGHAPMFADPSFADLSQEIGLASLGASDAEIERLARCYWFSVEFGLVSSATDDAARRDGDDSTLKAYGAGLLSSPGELLHACEERNARVLPWVPETAAVQDYPITEFQPIYFAAGSLLEAKEAMAAFCRNLPRPFYARYNAQTDRIWVDRSLRRAPRAEALPAA
ncbi:MAG: ACT domain-containing protein [Pseudomonadota bacterium]